MTKTKPPSITALALMRMIILAMPPGKSLLDVEKSSPIHEALQALLYEGQLPEGTNTALYDIKLRAEWPIYYARGTDPTSITLEEMKAALPSDIDVRPMEHQTEWGWTDDDGPRCFFPTERDAYAHALFTRNIIIR